ncbi:TrkH family potassium uptake protein [Psychroflexus gondwanensis]|jgi:trk system potassium uptake protein TrkH|uniref:Potassium uptake protein TrkH n=1 Tax=Psychroflexus gondwanensis ACAM 44 TaxID=1189619 RepID=N1WZ75_9FLAO|nr:TrkH family potassium uptake protein [Psychroflexus gondwanensis]EMY82389.1 potassium uptake protein TrkH [Psychroflexus gondwanensis ACAM 44]TXE19009.1 TrkH family potassium uptake protein [Psychroflexus gondwanensis]
MGVLLVFNGGFMLIPAIYSWFSQESAAFSIAVSAIISIFIGLLAMFFTKNHEKDISQREGYLIVSLGWLFMVLSGMLPYALSGEIQGIENIFFETMSGYTTTGASIVNDIEALPEGILLWRSLTHWIGGMGIIVLAVAILPLFGIGGMQLFSAESPGPSADKVKPKIADTAKRLWLIYFGYTLSETILLKVAGMTWFDASNHALSTLSTGGFSTKNASLAYWNDNPSIQYIVIFFMFLAGTNFVVSYYAFKGKISNVLHNEEFKWYLLFIIGATAITSLSIYYFSDPSIASIEYPMVFGEIESALRHGLFQVLAIITTTGFVSADYTLWTPLLTVLFFGLFFLGGSAGSTSGGIKVIRHLIMIKNGFQEFRRMLHPNAILPVRYKGSSVDQKIVYNILGFFILYSLSFIIGAAVFAGTGLDFETALGASASSLGNVGPAFGELSPVDNYASLSVFGKYWSSFLMLIGRLELFTVLILFTPYFWKNT